MKRWLLYIVTSLCLLGLGGSFIYSKWKSGISNKEYNEAVGRGLKAYALDLPEKMDFAGEAVPMDLFWVRESVDREMLTNIYWHSSTLLLLKRAHRYLPQIEPILKRNGVPDDIKFLAIIESNLTTVVSPAGAAGYWQFIKETGQRYGLEINEEVDERYNIEKSTTAACAYLKDGYARYNNWTLAAASYNAGFENISKPLTTQGSMSFYETMLNPETSRYIFRILAMKEVFSAPQKYGFIYRARDLYPNIPVKEIKIDSSIANLADFARKQGINYKILKEFNPWLRKNTLSNKTRKTYTLLIPEKADIYYSNLWKNPALFGGGTGDTL